MTARTDVKSTGKKLAGVGYSVMMRSYDLELASYHGDSPSALFLLKKIQSVRSDGGPRAAPPLSLAIAITSI
jgi:hypothetical protein